MEVFMNLRQMEAFRAVILTGSVTQAANQLFKTQPAVSMLINNLEEELGFILFERKKKRLYPTPEANYLYNEVEAIFSRLNEVNQTVKDIQNKQYGFLRIGCMPGPSTFFVPELLADFLEEHPKVRASLQTRTTDEVTKWVASNQYDVGLAEITSAHQNVDKKDLFNLPCICAIPAGHPLAKERSITPSMLDNEPIITLYTDHMTYHDMSQLFGSAGYNMNVRIQTRFFISALQFVERGLGISVMDPITVKSYCGYATPGKIVFRTFEPTIWYKFGLIYPVDAPRSMITTSFTKQLHDKICELEDNLETLLNWGDT
jgi:DNA-binding transcriptional LysR family regulator